MNLQKLVRALGLLPVVVQVLIVLGVIGLLVLVLVNPVAAAALTGLLLTLKMLLNPTSPGTPDK